MPIISAIVQAAKQNGLRFLVIGGHAVAHHHYSRTTEDTDLLIATEDRNGWIATITGLGYGLFHDGGNFLQFKPVVGDGWRLDLMLVNQETFQKMFAASETGTLEGMSVAMPSLAHLLAMKLHALKNAGGIRTLKDMNDVVNLLVNNKVDVSSEEFRQLVLKHGTIEIYTKLATTCGS